LRYKARPVQTEGAAVAVGPAPFVGRLAELRVLGAAVARMCEGRGGLVLVSGEAGIGKTRLADELVVRAGERGVRAFWGRAWEGDGAPPFWPWIQVIRGLLASSGADDALHRLGARAHALVPLLPELAERVPPARAAKVDADRSRFLLFDATAALLRAAADAAPTLLVLDDVHAADTASLRLLLFLARLRPPTRLLVLGCLRQREMRGAAATADLLGALAHEGEALVLGGLAAADVAALVHGRAGRFFADDVVRTIHEATGGNPLFVDEVVRLLLAEGPGASRGRASLPLPEGVRDAIRRRCAPLRPEARTLLRLAAVLGREFDVRTLGALAGLPAERLLDLLAGAADLGIVVPAAAGFRFAHVLVRDALYEELRPAERLRRHRQAAETLERLRGAPLAADLSAVAHHYLEAGGADDVRRAAGHARQAAERALAQLAPEEAVRLGERALRALAAHGAPDAERLPLLLLVGEAHRRGGDPGRARAAFAEAAAGARRLDDAELLARAALGFGHSKPTESGTADRALVAMLEDALRAIGPADRALRAHLLGRLGEELYFTEDREHGAELAAEAVAMARRLGREDVLARALVRRYFTAWGPDTADEGLALSGEAARVAARVGLREVELIATSWHVSDLLQHGDAQAADVAIAGYGEAAEALRLPEFRWRVRLLRAARALMRGEFERAADLAREAAAIEDGQHGATAVQFFAVQRVALALEGGRQDVLEDSVGMLHGLAERYPMLPVWRAAFARVCAELGRRDEARRELEVLAADAFAGVRRDGNWLTTMMNLAETAILLGDADRAAVLYGLLEPYARLHVVVAHCACFGSLERYLGRLAALVGRVAAATGHFARAEAADARTGAAPFVAQTRAAWAELLLAHGVEIERARALRDTARATARALGIPRLLARLDRLPGPPAERGGGPWTFRLEGEYWAIGPGDRVVRLRDARGIRYLHTLVAHPNRAFPAIELAGGRVTAPAGTLVDPRTGIAYRERVVELRTALDEALAHNDVGRIATLRAEMEWLGTSLADAVGLGGRLRRAGSTTERARTAVTKAIRGALRRITDETPALGHHLARSVRTGILCSYEPDPTQPVSWTL
jgi:hypothetical protein